MIFLGLNTGTSADAIDCVAIDFSGGNHVFIGGIEYPMPINLKADILKQVQADKLLIEDLIILKDRLSAHYIKAINKALSALNISVDQVCAVGIHGQTIHHKPGHNPPYSIQLADCGKISQQTRLNIVSDFRSVDIAVGGQGAPLIPAYQRFLLEQKNMKGAIFLNMGGIANISWIDRNQSGVFKGWDIGPCNSLMDLWVEKELGLPYDDAGSWAKSGDVISSLLDRFLQDSYFSLPSPKSTGREYFNLDWILAHLNGECSKDVQATLLELTVETIARAFDEISLSGKEYKIYLYGKGVNNTYLLERLKSRIGVRGFDNILDLGMESSYLEAGLFAWLAYCYVQKKAVNLVGITGASSPAVLGSCCVYG